MKLSSKPLSVNRNKQLLARAIACCIMLILTSCRIPTLRSPEPPAPLPPTFDGSTNPESSAQLTIEEFFNDPLLTDLIHNALNNNQELKILAQDIQIANNEILLRRGTYLPFVTAGGRAGLERPSLYTPLGAVERNLPYLPGKFFPEPLPDFMIAANVSWEVDIWRRLRNGRDAAALRYLATSEGRNYVVTRLVAEIAENYFTLMALDKRLEILDAIIALQEQSLDVSKKKMAGGQGTELPVQRFQGEVRKNQSEKLIIRQEIIQTENRINFLAGRFPQPVARSTTQFIDLNLHTLALGVPAQLLQNRPDIRQAERELAANGLDVKIARVAFFPQLNITGTVGYEAFNPKYLFNPEALVYNAMGELVAPLVNKRAIQAVYLTANARQLQSVYNYQRVVLNAFTEVINRVAAEYNYRNSIQIKKQQLMALEKSVEIANNLFQRGRVEYIEVLFAQRDLMDARMVIIETKRQQLAAVVNAFQALGGGNVIPVTPPGPPQQFQWHFWPRHDPATCAPPQPGQAAMAGAGAVGAIIPLALPPRQIDAAPPAGAPAMLPGQMVPADPAAPAMPAAPPGQAAPADPAAPAIPPMQPNAPPGPAMPPGPAAPGQGKPTSGSPQTAAPAETPAATSGIVQPTGLPFATPSVEPSPASADAWAKPGDITWRSAK